MESKGIRIYFFCVVMWLFPCFYLVLFTGEMTHMLTLTGDHHSQMILIMTDIERIHTGTFVTLHLYGNQPKMVQ